MSQKQICIKDIYSGKPDARDEATLNQDNFLRSYVMPPNFDMDGLLDGDKFMISGYKGTGKTALLLYLADQFKKRDETACNSFILFKSDFDNRKRDQWAKTMTVEREGFLTLPDFSAMWRWHLFQQMVEDNELQNGRLFVEDAAWEEFSQLVMAMVPQKEKKRTGLGGGKITFGLPVLGGLVNPKLDWEFTLENGEKVQGNFCDLIEETTNAFCCLTRTEVPYYIFLDELEAFYGDTEIFYRDLRLIRDLILEAKAMNMLLHQQGMAQTKVICAVRSEIISSINRFIESKEVNKVVDGFDCPLIWNYNNTASFRHPIMEILLKRIEVTERLHGMEGEREDLQRRWFPERIDTTDPVSFILNHNWSKPRDIVRLINAAQDSLHFEATSFNQAVLESSMPQYSRNSLTELREELRALYRAQEIDDIINCFTGFVDTFTLDKLRKQVQDYFPHSVLATRTLDVLNDLYRLGIIGNFNRSENRYRWQYRGDDRIILNDEWLITIHRGLRKALSTVPYRDKTKKPTEATVFGQSVDPSLIGSVVTLSDIVTTTNGGIKGKFGSHTGTVSRRRLGDIPSIMFAGGTLQVKVLGLNPLGGSYELEPVEEFPLPSHEVELVELQRTTNGGVRGTFGTPAWRGVGTVSSKQWKELSCPYPLSQISLRGKLAGRNPSGGSYRLELSDNPIEYVGESGDQQCSVPEMEKPYCLEVQVRTPSGGVRGVFGDGWVGTLSPRRLEEQGISLQEGDEVTVLVDRKNPNGDSWALTFVDEN